LKILDGCGSFGFVGAELVLDFLEDTLDAIFELG
jgi:hypothetical protein